MYSKEEIDKPINNRLTCEFFIFFLKASTSTLLSFATIIIIKITFFLRQNRHINADSCQYFFPQWKLITKTITNN